MADSALEIKPSAPSLRDLLEIFFRHRRLLTTVLPAAILLVVLYVLFVPRTYQSEMKILVQNNRGSTTLNPDKNTTITTTSDVTEQQINSQIEILHSRDVLDPVTDPGWGAVPVVKRPSDEVRSHEKKVDDLVRHLSTEPVRKSNVITVTYTGHSPREAQSTLQRLSSSFLSEQRQLLRPSGTTEFFNSEAARYREEWNEASKEFVAFQQLNQLVSLPDEEDALAKQIATAQDELRAIDTGISEARGRIQGGQVTLGEATERQTTSIKLLPNQQSAQELTTLLVTLENRRTALLTQFKATDRLVTEIDQQIAQTRSALTAAQNGGALERTTDVNPSWQQLRTQSLQSKVALSALESQRAGKLQQLRALRDRLAHTQSLTVEYNLLKSRADSLRENYTTFVQKMEQAEIEDAMDERKLLNVSIAEQPTLSYLPASPKPLTHLVLGIGSAVFLILAFLYFAELGRMTIATPRELEVSTGKPVLATVPLFRAGNTSIATSMQPFVHVSHAAGLREALERHVTPEGVGV